MFSKAEAAQRREAFWTAFGRYMAPHPSASGEKVSWVNYRTGERYLYFRMRAEAKGASIGIEITHPDEGIRLLYFEQFRELKGLLAGSTGEDWTWEAAATDEQGKPVSRIYASLEDVNIFRQEDWPAMISFFKPRLLALDDFWNGARYAFEALR